MQHSRFWLATAIIACIVLVGFVISVPHTRDVANQFGTKEGSTVPEVKIRDSYKKGVHVISGSLEAQNACSTANANAVISETSIEVQITLNDDEGICLQVLTPISFSTSVQAPIDMPIKVTVNGREATTTIL